MSELVEDGGYGLSTSLQKLASTVCLANQAVNIYREI
jgi:hypothetical protein